MKAYINSKSKHTIKTSYLGAVYRDIWTSGCSDGEVHAWQSSQVLPRLSGDENVLQVRKGSLCRVFSTQPLGALRSAHQLNSIMLTFTIKDQSKKCVKKFKKRTIKVCISFLGPPRHAILVSL